MNATLKTSRNQISKNVKRLAERNEKNVLVYGCGRFVNEVKGKLSNSNVSVNWAWFEPHTEIYKTVPSGEFKHVILDNVLNVIKDELPLWKVLKDAWSKVESGGSLWVNIYEGNRTGISEFTDNKCQRNKKKVEYLPMFKNLEGLKWRENLSTGFALEKA